MKSAQRGKLKNLKESLIAHRMANAKKESFNRMITDLDANIDKLSEAKPIKETELKSVGWKIHKEKPEKSVIVATNNDDKIKKLQEMMKKKNG